MKDIKKIALKVASKLKITPYLYYNFKYNNPFLLKEKLFKNKAITIFDVGAHDGRSIVEYKKKFPKSNIFSFEPTPETFKVLHNNFNEKYNINIFNLALTSFVGSTSFYINNSSFTNSILKLSDRNPLDFIKSQTSITVETTTIDVFCKEKNIERIHILKIDVQGADLDVLKGATEMLKSKCIDLIYIEVEFVEIYKDQPLFHDISMFLNEHKYKLHALYNLSYSKEGQIMYGDATFVIDN